MIRVPQAPVVGPADGTADRALIALGSPEAIEHITLNGQVWTFTNQVAAETEMGGFRRTWADPTGRTQMRLVAHISAAGAGGSYVKAQWSTDQTTWADFGPVRTTDQIVFTTVGAQKTAWLSIPAGAGTEVCLRLVGGGGNATGAPAYGLVSVQVR